MSVFFTERMKADGLFVYMWSWILGLIPDICPDCENVSGLRLRFNNSNPPTPPANVFKSAAESATTQWNEHRDNAVVFFEAEHSSEPNKRAIRRGGGGGGGRVSRLQSHQPWRHRWAMPRSWLRLFDQMKRI